MDTHNAHDTYLKGAYSSALSLDGFMYLLDSIRDGRIWRPTGEDAPTEEGRLTARHDRRRWVDSDTEEIPEGYDILSLADLIGTYNAIEGNGFVSDPKGHILSVTRYIRIDTENNRLVMDLDPALCREIQEAMEETWGL